MQDWRQNRHERHNKTDISINFNILRGHSRFFLLSILLNCTYSWTIKALRMLFFWMFHIINNRGVKNISYLCTRFISNSTFGSHKNHRLYRLHRFFPKPWGLSNLWNKREPLARRSQIWGIADSSEKNLWNLSNLWWKKERPKLK